MSPTGWKPKRRGGFLPDWEDPYFVYELKTQFHLSGGTAQEKIPAVPIKYMDVPELYGKPLRVICFAGAEVYAKKFFKDSLINGDTLFASSVAEKMLHLSEETKVTVENLIDAMLAGEEIQIEKI
jgi:hypothetical protein